MIMKSDYSRYIYFYLSYLIENNRIEEAKNILENIDYINTTYYYLREKVGLKMKFRKI